MFHKLRADLQSIKDRDPAARTLWEVFWLYPGVRAVMYYRVAHWFHGKGHYHVARRLSNRARRKTGIEIHPGAKIGKGLFIDHGMGVVIGETAQIGDYCTLYQGVTLGGTGKHKGKRHPTLGNNVMVGSGAKVLGPFTVHDNAKIAAGAVVLEEVPENCTAVGVPARIARRNGERVVQDLDQIHIPDPLAQEICKMRMQIERLQRDVQKLQSPDAQSLQTPAEQKLRSAGEQPPTSPDAQSAQSLSKQQPLPHSDVREASDEQKS